MPKRREFKPYVHGVIRLWCEGYTRGQIGKLHPVLTRGQIAGAVWRFQNPDAYRKSLETVVHRDRNAWDERRLTESWADRKKRREAERHAA